MEGNIMICAIHQPNFFPWIGYFDKIYRADRFVFMDGVDYPKRSWTNRVRIAVNEHAVWINCPVIRQEGRQKICDVLINDQKIDQNLDWREKIVKTIDLNYRKSLYYNEVSEFIYSLIDFRTEYLSEYNCNTIECLCKRLHIDTPFYKQTDLNTHYASTRLLIEITKKMDCSGYMCGGGAEGYQDDSLFAKEGVDLIYQNFIEPYYERRGEKCIAGLSVLDALFNVGFEKTECLIKRID